MTHTLQDPGRKDSTIRVPVELLDELRQVAKAHERSLAAEARVALAEHIRANAPPKDNQP
jgi:hypothetical protein